MIKMKRVSVSPPVSQLPGHKTFVRDKGDRGTPTDTERTPESVLSPDKATPRSPSRNDSNKGDNLKHLGPTFFNMPDGSADEIKSRTRPAEGEQYGHPYQDGVNNLRRRVNQRTATRVAYRYLISKLKVTERPWVNSKGVGNTTYMYDRPIRPQNQQPADERRKKHLYYKRNKQRIKRHNKRRYRQRYRNKPKWNKRQTIRQNTDSTRRPPNRALLNKNRKIHQKNFQKRKRNASSIRVADLFLGVV